MAIAKKIDPAALARAFADEVSTIPDVKRLWYRARPHEYEPGRVRLDFDVQLEKESKAAATAITDALARLQEQYFDDVGITLMSFTLTPDDPLTLDDLLGEDPIELRLRRARPCAAEPGTRRCFERETLFKISSDASCVDHRRRSSVVRVHGISTCRSAMTCRTAWLGHRASSFMLGWSCVAVGRTISQIPGRSPSSRTSTRCWTRTSARSWRITSTRRGARTRRRPTCTWDRSRPVAG